MGPNTRSTVVDGLSTVVDGLSVKKRPDRSKQCHSLQFAKCIPGLLHYYTGLIMISSI